MKFLPIVIFFFLAVIFAASLYTKKEVTTDNLRIGHKLAEFSVSELDSQEFSGKVIVLNAFASWCEGCLAEHKLLLDLSKNKSVNLYGLAWKDTPEKIAKYIEKHGNPYQKIGIDTDGKTTVALGLSGVPETFILDKNGKIAFHYKAALTDDIVQQTIIPLVEKLQNAPTN